MPARNDRNETTPPPLPAMPEDSIASMDINSLQKIERPLPIRLDKDKHPERAVTPPTPTVTDRRIALKHKEELEGHHEAARRKEEKWFRPGRVRLKEVDPRKLLQKREGTMHKKTDEFQTNHNAERVDVNGKFVYVMAFDGVALTGIEVSTVGEAYMEAEGEGSDLDLDEAMAVAEEDDKVPSMDELAFGDKPVPARSVADTESVTSIGKRSSVARRGSLNFTTHDGTHLLREEIYGRRCNELGIRPHTGMHRFFDACRENGIHFSNLEVVSFRNFFLGDRGVMSVLPLFSFGINIRCLSLAGNGMRDSSFNQVMKSLCDEGGHILPKLIVLDLSDNHLSRTVGDEIMRCLEVVPSLLLVGVKGIGLQAMKHEALIRRALHNFECAHLGDALEAWRVTGDPTFFSDRELWVRCNTVATQKFAPEWLKENEDNSLFRTDFSVGITSVLRRFSLTDLNPHNLSKSNLSMHDRDEVASAADSDARSHTPMGRLNLLSPPPQASFQVATPS